MRRHYPACTVKISSICSIMAMKWKLLHYLGSRSENINPLDAGSLPRGHMTPSGGGEQGTRQFQSVTNPLSHRMSSSQSGGVRRGAHDTHASCR